jgi:hypothetical protein
MLDDEDLKYGVSFSIRNYEVGNKQYLGGKRKNNYTVVELELRTNGVKILIN